LRASTWRSDGNGFPGLPAATDRKPGLGAVILVYKATVSRCALHSDFPHFFLQFPLRILPVFDLVMAPASHLAMALIASAAFHAASAARLPVMRHLRQGSSRVSRRDNRGIIALADEQDTIYLANMWVGFTPSVRYGPKYLMDSTLAGQQFMVQADTGSRYGERNHVQPNHLHYLPGFSAIFGCKPTAP
jgi:hypothetical protein